MRFSFRCAGLVLLVSILAAGCVDGGRDGEAPDVDPAPSDAVQEVFQRDALPSHSASTPGLLERAPLEAPSAFASLSPEGLVAEGFYACMVAAGVPMGAVAMPDGGLYVGFHWRDVESALGRDPAGQAQWAVLTQFPQEADPREVLAKTVAEHGGGYVLEVDGADMSGPFETCHSEYPYVQPEYDYTYGGNPLQEFDGAMWFVVAARTWATCARDNGLPTVADPPDPTVDGHGIVEMVVPLSTEPATFEALFEACPLKWTEDGETVSVANIRAETSVEARRPGGSFAGTPASEDGRLRAMHNELMKIYRNAEREAFPQLAG